MREILFKAKRKDGKWVEGLPYYSPGNGTWAILHSNGWAPSYSNPDEGETNEVTLVDYDTLTQYTGFEDREGRKIFVSDILSINGKVYTVKLFNGMYIVDCEAEMHSYHLYDIANECEVIGNIHDKKEVTNE